MNFLVCGRSVAVWCSACNSSAELGMRGRWGVRAQPQHHSGGGFLLCMCSYNCRHTVADPSGCNSDPSRLYLYECMALLQHSF